MSTNSNQCSLSPPQRMEAYCTPAPFQSAGSEKYFLVKEAYGSTTGGSQGNVVEGYRNVNMPRGGGASRGGFRPRGGFRSRGGFRPRGGSPPAYRQR